MFLTVGTIEPKFWRQFCHLINAPELADQQFDFDHEDEQIKRIAAAVKTKTLAEWETLIGADEFCVTPVHTVDEALDSDITKEAGMLVKKQEDVGEITYVQPAFKMSVTPGSIRRRAPRLGEHNAEILQALGYDTAAREQLKKDGAI